MSIRRAEEGDCLAALERILGADVLRRLQPEASGEHRQAPQERLLALVEQVVAPGQRRPQRLLAGHGRAAPRREQVERVVEALDDLLGGEGAHPRRRQLDRQRHPVEPVAECRDRRRVVVVKLEAGGGLGRPRGEEPHRLRLQRLFRERAVGKHRQGERGNPPGHLAGNAEGLAAGRQHREAGAAAEQRLDEVRDGIHQVLAVVEQEQLLAIADVPCEGDLGGAVGGEPRVQGLGDRRSDQPGLAECGQLHRPDTVGEVLPALTCELQREPGLAAAAGPGQGEEPRVAQQGGELGQLALAADEARQLGREVAGAPAGRWRLTLGGLDLRLRLEAPREYPLVEAARLVVGLVLELAAQAPLQLLKLGQRLLPPPPARVEAHQRPVGGLVKGLVDQEVAQACDRRRPIGRRLELGQLDSEREPKLAQGGASRCGPLLVAVLGQQLAFVGVERRSVGVGVASLPGARRGLLEGEDVDPHRIAGAESDHVVVQLQTAPALEPGRVERPPSRIDRLMQVVAGGGRVAARPQDLGGLVSVQPPLRREGEELDQGLRLAQPPGVVGDDIAVPADRERPEEADAQRLLAHPCAFLPGTCAGSKYPANVDPPALGPPAGARLHSSCGQHGTGKRLRDDG